ncbi:MAG: DEAD/DEAH box helicase [Pseudomonadota bacterium]|nr:DEAD/DEAH box helicase [Pseudomonadota bacterium]
MSFDTAHPSLVAALTERGYTEATPVQASVLAPEVKGRDLLVSARTGSGKTVAFGICLAETLLGDATSFSRASTPLALVVAPTRELALQVKQELAWLFAGSGARVVSCVGGMDVRREAYELHDGAHIVVGTPGRLCDHLHRGTLKLDGAKAVVLDEADEMLDLGFRDELEVLLDATPETRRTLMFSATLPREILGLAQRYQRDALRIAATDANEQHADIEHRAVIVSPREREHVVVNLLRFMAPPTALVFCATREGVGHMHAGLVERGFTAVALSGELSQNERARALQSLRDGRARVLVATDVAARGLDLPQLNLVIHADLPHDGQVLLHRSGRTGRAGKKGTSVLIVPFTRVRMAERLLREARLTPRWSEPPMADAVRAKDQERIGAELANALAEPTEEEAEAAKALVAAHSPEAIAAALLRIARQGWPEPEELPETDAIQARMAGRPRQVSPIEQDRFMGRGSAPQRPARGEGPPGPPMRHDRPVSRREVEPSEPDVESSGSDAGWGSPKVVTERVHVTPTPPRPAPAPAPRPEAPPKELTPEQAAKAAAKAARRAEWAAKEAAKLAAGGEAPAESSSASPAPAASTSTATTQGGTDEGGKRRAYTRTTDADHAGRTRVATTFGPHADGSPRGGGDSPARPPRRDAPGWDTAGGPPAARTRRDDASWDTATGTEGPGERSRAVGARETRGVWFRMNVGRNDQADPRWLIPLICRRGGVEKSDIGAIRVHDDETRFEVAGDVASRFAQAVKRPDRKDPWVRFQVLARG